MSRQSVELANVIYWDRAAGDKVYIDSVQLAIDEHSFANRQVFVRFAYGPDLDLSIWDMDRLVAAYQSLREATPLVQDHSTRPDKCDFSVPLISKKRREK